MSFCWFCSHSFTWPTVLTAAGSITLCICVYKRIHLQLSFVVLQLTWLWQPIVYPTHYTIHETGSSHYYYECIYMSTTERLMYSHLYIGNMDCMKPALLLSKSITNASKSYHQHQKSTLDMNCVEKYNVFICATLGTGWRDDINAFLLVRTNFSMEYCNEKLKVIHTKSARR